MLKSELQAAASWAGLLCVYSFNGFQDCMLSNFYDNDFPIWYIPSVIFGGARSPQCGEGGGGRLPRNSLGRSINGISN